MEPRGVATSLLWILVLPLLLAGVLRGLSVGPDVETVAETLRSGGTEARHDALEWAARLRRTSLVADMAPMLQDADAKIRENTVEALRYYSARDAIPALEAAALRHPEQSRDMAKAIYSTFHPASLDALLRIHANHPDKEVGTRVYRGGGRQELLLNQRQGYYSLGNHVWNPMGQYLSSAGALFPEGRAIIDRGPAPGSHWPGMDRPWIQPAEAAP